MFDSFSLDPQCFRRYSQWGSVGCAVSVQTNFAKHFVQKNGHTLMHVACNGSDLRVLMTTSTKRRSAREILRLNKSDFRE